MKFDGPIQRNLRREKGHAESIARLQGVDFTAETCWFESHPKRTASDRAEIIPSTVKSKFSGQTR